MEGKCYIIKYKDGSFFYEYKNNTYYATMSILYCKRFETLEEAQEVMYHLKTDRDIDCNIYEINIELVE